MNEKEIRHLCSYLVNLKKASAEEMRKSVYANYSAFIRTSKEISDLEGELLSLRNLLSSQSALVHDLAEGIRMDTLSPDLNCSKPEDMSSILQTQHSNNESWLGEFLDTLEVLLAERRVDEALSKLEGGEKIIEETKKQSLSPNALCLLQNAITQQRKKLSEQLAETASQSSTRGVELRSSILAMKRLGDGHQAHTLLLYSHHQKLQCNIQSIRPSSSYITKLSQIVFSTIAQAANDSLALFGEDTAHTSELVTWAVKQTNDFAILVKRHSLALSAASGAFRAAIECVQICLGHCFLLEIRGLALSPVIMKFFKPYIEQALCANFKRIEQSTAALAAADDWSLSYPPLVSMRALSSASLGNVIASQPKLSSSAHRFNSMVQEMFEDVGPLEGMQLWDVALEGLLQAFNSYVNMLISAIPGSIENEESVHSSGHKIVRMAQLESQQIALLANASLMADELLPRAAMKLLSLKHGTSEPPRRGSERQKIHPEQRELKKRFQRSVDRLRDSFCRHHVLELIFSQDGDSRLTAEMYISMDGHDDQPEWFPSPIFQVLFAKLTQMASIAMDMFVGRERFATILLMRLIETIILWLSDDQTFWDAIEEGPNALGPYGLQQFYLDMEFVIHFSSHGRYLSRNLHQVIKNITARALDSVSVTGLDPYSVLPEDEWFSEIAQVAIKVLSRECTFENVERDVISPTLSISTKSISVVSHESN